MRIDGHRFVHETAEGLERTRRGLAAGGHLEDVAVRFAKRGIVVGPEHRFFTGEPAAPGRGPAGAVAHRARQRHRAAHDTAGGRVDVERGGAAAGPGVVAPPAVEGRPHFDLVVPHEMHQTAGACERRHAVVGARRHAAARQRVAGPSEGVITESLGQVQQRQPRGVVEDGLQGPVSPRLGGTAVASDRLSEGRQRHGNGGPGKGSSSKERASWD